MRRPTRALLPALLLLAALPPAGCSGTSTTIAPEPTAVFVPDADPAPDGSVTLQPGGTDARTFEVRVSVRGIQDIFGAAFRIAFDKTKVVFAGYDASGSVLAEGGAVVTCFVDATSEVGTVKVGIGRVQNGDGTVPGVDVTEPADLLVIRLLAASDAADVAIDFQTDFCELRDSAQPPPGNLIPATWSGGAVTVD